jgi:hypothetical protein
VATADDVRRIALGLPGVEQVGSQYKVGGKLLAWPWRERVHPKRPRLENADVLVVRTRDEAEKFELIAEEPATFFTEPHYDGYAAVLIRLRAISTDRLESILTDAWRRQTDAPSRRAAGP